MRIYPFYGFICDFLEFPSVNLSKFSQYIDSARIRILNSQKVGFVWAAF